MTSDDFVMLARHRIKIEFLDRAAAFAEDVRNIQAQFAARGGSYGSPLILAVRKRVKQEYDVRGVLAWQILARVAAIQRVQITTDVAAKIKSEIQSALDVFCQDLQKTDAQILTRLPGTTNWPDHFSLKQLALARTESEVDIAASTAPPGESTATGGTVNIYHPVGVVQTGAGAFASLTQYFGESEREQLTAALKSVRDEVQAAGDIPAQNRAELLAVVSDAESEARSATPNLVRLRGALSAIGFSIQTLGSARAAYELLKGVAALVGVALP